jgi:hypothetical protein
MVADGDHGIVHEQSVTVDEAARAQTDLGSVAALEPRHDDCVIAELRDELTQDRSPRVVFVGSRCVETVKEAPATTPVLYEVRLIEVPLASEHSFPLFAHVAIVGEVPILGKGRARPSAAEASGRHHEP